MQHAPPFIIPDAAMMTRAPSILFTRFDSSRVLHANIE
jgi:hypothetical protein